MYTQNSDLPQNIKSVLPSHGQTIYRKALNRALEEYKNPSSRKDKQSSEETVARKVAWRAVKNIYRKDEDGTWVRK